MSRSDHHGISKRVLVYEKEFKRAGDYHSLDWKLLGAVGDRETLVGTAPGYEPHGPAGICDHGHGHGLMSIDDRSHKAFINKKLPDGTFAWKNAWENINYASGYLSSLIQLFSNDERFGLAAYNCGPENVREAIKKHAGVVNGARYAAVDMRTANKDYSADVIARRQQLELELVKLIAEWRR